MGTRKNGTVARPRDPIVRVLAAVLLAAFAADSPAEVAGQEQQDVQALFVTGGGTYDNSIFRVMESLEGIASTHVPSDVAAFAPGFGKTTDVVVLYNVSRTLPEEARDRLRGFVDEKRGVVVLHHALASYGDWPWWWKEVTGGRYVLSPEEGLPASRYSPGKSIIALPTGNHPITAALGGLPIHLYDETYQGLWLSSEVEILLRTGLASSDGPLMWIGPQLGSRVVVFQPGHASSVHWNLGFRTLLRRAVLWAAGRL